MGRLDALFATQSSLDAQRTPLVVLEGVVQAGSYDPTNGTVQVLIGHTVAAASFGDGNQPMIVTAALATIGYGDQYGPIGNERALVFRAGTHYIALIEFGPEDSPNVPSGERWITHRNPQTGTVDAIVKITNDGPTNGDGKGGVHVGNGAGQVKLDTKSGALSHVINDTAQTIQTTAGQVYTLYDASGKAISHVVGTAGRLNLGDITANLGATRAVAANADLTSTIQSIVNTSLVKMAAAMGATCSSNQGELGAYYGFAVALANAWEASNFISGISGIIPTAPACSSSVFVKA